MNKHIARIRWFVCWVGFHEWQANYKLEMSPRCKFNSDHKENWWLKILLRRNGLL